MADEDGIRSQGLKALPLLLKDAGSPDVDIRVRARRLAKLILLDYFRNEAPRGMRFVPGQPAIDNGRARMKGGFYLAVKEVTVLEYLRYLKQTAGIPVLRFKDLDARAPIVSVTLREAQAYAKWRKARLPTHDELLAAASLNGRAPYPWGSAFEPHRINSRESGLGKPLPPGTRPEGNTPDGLEDLIGNIAEWTPSRAKAGGTRFRVVGGSFLRHAKGVISGGRFVTYNLRATETRRDVGFRLARSLPPLPTLR